MPPKVRIPITEKGSLVKYGYSTSKSAASRHTALDKAVKATSNVTVRRKLNAVAVLTKNTRPYRSSIFRADANYLKKKD